MFASVIEAVGEDRSGWSGAALSARLLELLEAEQKIRAEVLRGAGQWDAVAAWAEDGALSASSWLAHRSATTKADATVLVRTARLVQGNERTAKALAAGDLSPAHVEVAARAVRHVEDLYPDHEDGIIDAAQQVTPEQFTVVMHHWRNHADAIIDREPPEVRFDRQHLHVTPVLDHMVRVDGYLDVEAGARLAATLDAIEPPDPSDGPERPRTLAQRRADALVRLVIGERPAPPTSLDVIIDLDTLLGRLPADWCDAHHRIPWIEGGDTDLDNLELRCRRHRIKEHQRRRAPPRERAA